MKRFALFLFVAGSIPGAGILADSPAIATLTVTVGKNMTALKSRWPDYFGSHYADSAQRVGHSGNTIRSFGGTHVGIEESSDPLTPAHKGPFTGKDVRIRLEDFRSHKKRGGKSAERLIPELLEHDLRAIYIMTNIVRPTLEPFDKDLAYWTVRQIHEKYPEAHKCVYWQIGNEVVSGHFNPKNLSREQKGRGLGADGTFFGYDLAWKENYYVNDYLAPAVEAIERAAQDVYKDPRKIKILLGSMNPYDRSNLRFLHNVMDRKFDSKQAPSLQGEPVWKHCDVLTVHYMAGNERNVKTLQQYHDDYLKTGRVKGIWLTEDHGAAGKGPVTIVDRGLRFLNWVAKNNLDANQTRLVWWGEGESKPGGTGKEATALLGNFFTDHPLFHARQAHSGGEVHVLSDGAGDKIGRILIALVPERGSALAMSTLKVSLPAGAAQQKWSVEAVQFSATAAAEKITPKTTVDNDSLLLKLERRVQEPFLFFLSVAASDPPNR